MIRTQLLTNDGNWLTGGEELIQSWQESNSSFIWIDLEDEEPANERAMLLSLHCHKMAIEDVQRYRHPPKTETFDHHTLFLYRVSLNLIPI